MAACHGYNSLSFPTPNPSPLRKEGLKSALASRVYFGRGREGGTLVNYIALSINTFRTRYD